MISGPKQKEWITHWLSLCVFKGGTLTLLQIKGFTLVLFNKI
jgi:hypothetical protein